MKKIAYIAARDFVATVATKGFIVGLLIMPARRHAAGDRVAAPLQPAEFPRAGASGDRRSDRGRRRRVADGGRSGDDRGAPRGRGAPGAGRGAAGGTPAGRERAARHAPRRRVVLGAVPNLTVVARPPDADAQREKEWLTQEEPDEARHLALVVVHPDAVVPATGADLRHLRPVRAGKSGRPDRDRGAGETCARRLSPRGRGPRTLDRGRIDALMRVDRVPSVTVTKDAERRTVGAFNRMLPFVFAGLMVFGIMIGGQSLMTSTIEEKSSRVVEVLLSAVSPMELMAGKIVGQMGVSLVVLGLYLAMGIAALLSFALFGLLDPWLLFYLVVFFVIAYVVNASLMVAVGAAVNEMREAQSLMMPIMLLLMAPWILAQPIARDPNSTFSTVISFIPPVNTFAMLIRLTSVTPPPLWQVWLSIAIGVASAFAAVWFAAKVFRIGLLMYGKPPDFATLIRWARAA